jgi:hypothetical protein
MGHRSTLSILAAGFALGTASPAVAQVPSLPCDVGDACIELLGDVSGRTLEAGKYLVSDDLVVNAGATLTVQAGATLYFLPLTADTDGAELRVQGRLALLGTADQPVVLTSNTTASVPGDWPGVTVSRSEGNVIRHARIQNASTGLTLNDATAEISDSTFSDSYTAIRSARSSLVISDNTIAVATAGRTN